MPVDSLQGYLLVVHNLHLSEVHTKMNRSMATTTSVVTLILVVFHGVNALNLESTYEGTCSDFKTVSVDIDWAMSQNLWYYPLMSRYDLFHCTADFLKDKDPKDIREDEAYYNTCMTLRFGGDKYSPLLFFKAHEKYLTYSLKPIRGFQGFYWEVEDEGQYEGDYMKGTSYLTLTDNSTFIVISSCLNSGEMTWCVISNVKQLPETTTNLIYDHAESLGFKREHFTGFRYDSCKEGFELQPSKDEL